MRSAGKLAERTDLVRSRDKTRHSGCYETWLVEVGDIVGFISSSALVCAWSKVAASLSVSWLEK
jgi:hypothetical protein